MTTEKSRNTSLVPLLIAAAALLARGPLARAADVPFDASYMGTYQVSFATGSNGNNQLSFHGTGLGLYLGESSVDGHSEMAPGSSPNCTQIVNDSVTLTGANGDKLLLVNSGEDCIFAENGSLVIRGTGVMRIVSGTGRFAGATGLGTWVVTAPVTNITGTGAEGTFALRFTGRLTLNN